MKRRNFVPSPTPPEEYEGDSDREWTVAGVVGQSVDVFGVERYEVKWGDGWQRKDRTNTTWERLGGSDTVDSLIRRWNRKQEQKRLATAETFPGIAIGVAKHQMLNEERTTYELVRGERELRRMHPRREDVRADCVGPLLHLGPAASAGAGGSARARENSNSNPNSRSRSPEVPSSPPPPPQRQVRPIPRRAIVARALSSPDISDGEPLVPEDPPEQPRQTREALEEQWTRKLRGSASVTFVNDVNSAEIPRLVDGFQYVERSYVRAADVPANDHLADILVSCECEEGCIDAEECGCQDPSELTDGLGNKVFAYSKKGLFNFHLPPGTEVIECNASCSCDEQCPNRVAQLPRDVPIEVFRTRERGWGARATAPLPKGKVVGIYTGRREEAGRRYDERKSYIFDLDVRESAEDEDEDETEKFSVDGYAYGNWTRFVNHSCEPNMRVYPVVWDTIPELNQPYLAFVALQDIPARTELSIDYDPKAGEEARTAKQKGRQTVPEGARDCQCGTESCRGWVRV